MNCLSNLNSGIPETLDTLSTLKKNLTKFNSYALVIDIFE